VGHITIVDMDLIEHTNLARCVFFRQGDEGKYKAEVLANSAKNLNSDISTSFFSVPVQKLGNAFLQNFDLVIAGLDNREARIWLGASLRRLGKVWIDGAIEGLMGKVQTFTPTGPCYACSMTDEEWKILAHRRSCSLLGIDEMIGGHTPTNATTSSIIAGIETQEAIKYLVGKSELGAIENKIFRIIGEQMATFLSVVDLDENCPYHDDMVLPTKVYKLPRTLLEVWTELKLDSQEYISFYDDVVFIDPCTNCHTPPELGYADLMAKVGTCKSCGETRQDRSFNRVRKDDLASQVFLKKEYFPYSSLIKIESENPYTVTLKVDINE
jgi:adenylyltransferase/sulfurtransferase